MRIAIKKNTHIKLTTLCTLLASCYVAQIPLDGNGWSVLSPSGNSKLVHVSSSAGNDTTGNGTIAQPYRTINKGYAQLRDGYPDWLLLKNGDTWQEMLGGQVALNNRFHPFSKSGKSANEPIVVTSYGTPCLVKPTILSDSIAGLWLSKSSPDTLKNVVVNGIRFYANTRDPQSSSYVSANGSAGFTIIYKTENILIEDCNFDYYTGNAIQGANANDYAKNIKLRRNSITNCYSTASHCQGLFVSKAIGLLIEENTFDHNGWNNTISGAGATIFNHNIYIHDVVDSITHKPNTKKVIVRGNIISRGSSHGLQLRSGGVIENNLFLDNAIALFVRRDSSNVNNNVVLGATDIGGPSNPRGMGIEIQPCEFITVENNIVAHKPTNTAGSNGFAFSLVNNVPADYNYTYCNYVNNPKGIIKNNIAYDWKGTHLLHSLIPMNQNSLCKNDWISLEIDHNIFNELAGSSNMVSTQFGNFPSYLNVHHNTYFTNRTPNDWFRKTLTSNITTSYSYNQWNEINKDSQIVSFVDPYRTMASYQTSMGGVPNLQGFINEALNQNKCNWNVNYTANSVNNYIRKGFCKTSDVPSANFVHSSSVNQFTFYPFSAVADSWAWDFGDGSTSNLQNPVHTYTSNGNYTVKLIVKNKCGADTANKVVNLAVGNNELHKSNHFSVYPNPVSQTLSIALTGSINGKIDIQIINSLGQTVLAITDAEPTDNALKKIDVANLKPGFYTVKLITNGFIFNQHLIKQ